MLHRHDFLKPAAPEEMSAFDLRDALNFVWRQWKVILGAALLGLLLGAVHVSRQTPIYTATAQLFLDPSKEKPATTEAVFSELLNFDQSAIESQMAIIRSSALLRRVVEKERLVTDPEFGAAPSASPRPAGLGARLRAFLGQAPSPEKTKPAEPVATPTDPNDPLMIATVESVKGAVGVVREGQAYVLSVSFNSSDPEKAARLANAVADAYVVDKLDARYEAAKRASSWLSDRLVDLRKQLRESEEAVARFRAENNLAQAAQGGTLNQDQLGQLNVRLVAARAEAAEKKTRVDILQKIEAKGGNITALPDLIAQGPIADLRKQANEISRQEADLLARYSRSHPSVVNIHAQLTDIQRAINAEVQRLAANIRTDYELAKARQDAIEKSLREASGQADLDNTKAITLRELERNAAVNKSLFEDFLQRARVTQEQSTFEARDARVITPALPPGAPSAPKKTQAMLMALIMGLIGGAAGAYALELFNAGFTTPRQIEQFLDVPLLASISRMEARDRTSDGVVLSIPEYAVAKPLSRLSEELRTLRNAIQMSDVDHPPKVLQVSSSIPEEGKSTISLALASSATFSGLKTLVIDADLRHASASRYFKLEKSKGLVDYLIGESDLQSALYYSDAARVWVLPAGGKTQNAADLLGSEKLRTLIATLRKEYDLIVIDTPPTGPVVDSLIVSGLVDKVIFVVRWAFTAREMVARSIQRLGGHPKVAGVVFNQVVDSRAQKYGKYAYSHYYGGAYYKRYYSE